MTEVAGVEEATTEIVQTEAAEKPAGRDYDAEATEQGWRPQEEWTGKPENWKDAKTWVENGEIHAKVSRIEKSFDERLAKLAKVNERTVEAIRAQHAKEIAELTTDRKAAIKAGDVEEVERLDKAIEVHKELGPEPASEADNEKIQSDWINTQDWWAVNVEMTDFAIRMSQAILAKNPKITMAENLERTVALLKKKYPEEFGLAAEPQKKPAAANGHAPVDGGGEFPITTLKSDPLAKLPAAERAQAKSDMAKYPTIYPTAQSWVDTLNAKT